jgi:hypothetical protein
MTTVRQYQDADFRDLIGPEDLMPPETSGGIKLCSQSWAKCFWDIAEKERQRIRHE